MSQNNRRIGITFGYKIKSSIYFTYCWQVVDCSVTEFCDIKQNEHFIDLHFSKYQSNVSFFIVEIKCCLSGNKQQTQKYWGVLRKTIDLWNWNRSPNKMGKDCHFPIMLHDIYEQFTLNKPRSERCRGPQASTNIWVS